MEKRILLSFLLSTFVLVCIHNGLLPPISLWGEILQISKEFKDYERKGGTNSYILIDKSERFLEVYLNQTRIAKYSVVFGMEPKGFKLREGDMKTPEGVYHILSVSDHSEWGKFIWLDYPNAKDWRRHLIAKIKGEVPIFARIGGEIGIHGVPYGEDFLITNKKDWTLGCVSLKREDVNHLTRLLSTLDKEIPVIIRP